MSGSFGVFGMIAGQYRPRRLSTKVSLTATRQSLSSASRSNSLRCDSDSLPGTGRPWRFLRGCALDSRLTLYVAMLDQEKSAGGHSRPRLGHWWTDCRQGPAGSPVEPVRGHGGTSASASSICCGCRRSGGQGLSRGSIRCFAGSSTSTDSKCQARQAPAPTAPTRWPSESSARSSPRLIRTLAASDLQGLAFRQVDHASAHRWRASAACGWRDPSLGSNGFAVSIGFSPSDWSCLPGFCGGRP